MAAANPTNESLARVVFLGRTGDGKSTAGNALVAAAGYDGPERFEEGRGAGSHTHEPKSIVVDGVEAIDMPGLMDTAGVVEDETNLRKVVDTARAAPELHAGLLVINEQAPRFDAAMQDAVKILVDSFGSAILRRLGILYTRAYGGVSAAEARAHAASVAALIAQKVGIPELELPFWQIDAHPERSPGVTAEHIAAQRAGRDQALRELLRWIRAQTPMSTVDFVYGEYELRRAAREAEEARVRDNTVVSSVNESRVVTYNRVSTPIYTNVERSRDEWIGGMVPKWGKMGKRTVHWTERVQSGERITLYKREESRTVDTLGSGRVVYGDWRAVREWTESG